MGKVRDASKAEKETSDEKEFLIRKASQQYLSRRESRFSGIILSDDRE